MARPSLKTQTFVLHPLVCATQHLGTGIVARIASFGTATGTVLLVIALGKMEDPSGNHFIHRVRMTQEEDAEEEDRYLLVGIGHRRRHLPRPIRGTQVEEGEEAAGMVDR